MATAPDLRRRADAVDDEVEVGAEVGAEAGAFCLDGFLPYRLSVASNRVSRAFASRYADEFGISIPEWRVMAVLGERAPVSSNAVSEATAMDKAKVSRAVSALLHKALIKKAPDPGDQRLLRLTLTAKGRKVYATIVPRARQLEAELTAGLSAAERAELDRLLDKLHARLGALEAGGGEGA